MPRDPDSPWEDQPAYMDVGYSGRWFAGDVDLRDRIGAGLGRVINVDMVADETVGDVGKFQLFFWPAVFLLIGVVWAQAPSQTPTANVPTATPQTNPTNLPTVTATATMVSPVPQPPAPKNPVSAVPEEHGHWVFIPDKGQPNLPPGYSIPPAQPAHH